MRAAFVRYQWENESRTIATFFFRPDGRYRYEAGQYAAISLPHTPADSRGYERTMTLSSSPDDELLAFTMRIMSSKPAADRGDAGSSFKRALIAMRPGENINIFESMGDLVLPLDSGTPLVFIAGGVGIASFTGMVTWLTRHKDKRNIQLYYVVARPGDVVMQTTFDDYTEVGDLTRSIYTPDVKRLTAQTITDAAKPDSLFYISGTERMAEYFKNALLAAGIPRSNIVFDYFDGYSEL